MTVLLIVPATTQYRRSIRAVAVAHGAPDGVMMALAPELPPLLWCGTEGLLLTVLSPCCHVDRWTHLVIVAGRVRLR